MTPPRGMFCRNCVYDLHSATSGRCPECAGAFNPDDPCTTLESSTRWAQCCYRASYYLVGLRNRICLEDTRLCKECHTDLKGVTGEGCPLCGRSVRPGGGTSNWFGRLISKFHNQFRFVCFWRGTVFPMITFIVGIEALITRTTVVPCLTGYSMLGGELFPVKGVAAIAMGVSYVGVALWLHSRYFWGRVDPVWRVSGLGAIAGMTMMFSGWLYTVYVFIFDAV